MSLAHNLSKIYKMEKSKKAVNLLAGTFSFIILNILFFAIMFIFVSQIGTGSNLIEQSYAKQIALVLDGSRPGTEISIDISEIYNLAEKNKFEGQIVKLEYKENSVRVDVGSGGYVHYSFTDLEGISYSLDNQLKTLTIKI